jgi:glycosyltransferase involved in cell wall biosynthesis
MKTYLIYIGNKLSRWGKTPTTIETMSVRFEEIFFVRSFSHFKNPIFRILHMLWGVYANRKKNSIVLIDTYSTFAFNYAWILAILCRQIEIPYYVFLHGGNFESRMQNSFLRVEFILSNAKGVISPSGFLKEKVNQYFPEIHVEVIPNSIDSSRYKCIKRNPREIVLFWLRSFHEIYNPQMAISVIEELLLRGCLAKIHMVGPDKDGTLGHFNEIISIKKLKDNIFTYGKLEFSEWMKISDKCNYFVNTTNVDNSPVSVIEAMALGLPVISTNVGGLPFLIQNGINGFLVEPNDAIAMADAIINIQNDSELFNKITGEGLKTANSHCWSNVKNIWFDFLKP